jgi:adenylosuccinate synthase
MSVCAVVGGQYGSEGKGHVVAHIAREYDHHVRVGAANAGHTLWSRIGGPGSNSEIWTKHVMQQVPCAAYANPGAKLYIGPGALISRNILLDELERLERWRFTHRLPAPTLYVDERAHVIQSNHIEREQCSGLAERIGSTSTIAKEGIGSAQAARVMREGSCVLAHEYGWPAAVVVTDVPAMLATADGILLEGTQGYGLSLTTGKFPYVTSRNTTAAGLCADCGIAPTRLDRVVLVVRTYPIRVAGHSGPFAPDSHEIKWSDLGVEPERTTVTKLERRVGTFSWDQLVEAAQVNGATEVALTFADYVDPEVAGERRLASSDVIDLVEAIGGMSRAPVTLVGTGPRTMIDLRSEAAEVEDVQKKIGEYR